MKRDPFVNVNLRVGVGTRTGVSSLVYRGECYGLLGGTSMGAVEDRSTTISAQWLAWRRLYGGVMLEYLGLYCFGLPLVSNL